MIASIYQFLEQIGYAHPLHPAATHIPVGCIIAAFLFLLVSSWRRNPAFFQSARHCMGLALLFLPVTGLLGYMDWQQNYGGAGITSIKIKIILGALLFVMLLIAISGRKHASRPTRGHFLVCAICLGLAVGLGYFGGELVYGTPKTEKGNLPVTATIQNGADLFRKNCAFCHHYDTTEKKVGPGLKAISKQASLPTSGWAMTDENIRKQIKTPFAEMPPFEHLSDQQVDELIAYIKIL